jgi:hypothetical protein
MGTYEIDVSITLRIPSPGHLVSYSDSTTGKIIPSGDAPIARQPERVTIAGSLAALQLIVANQGWKSAVAETAMRLLVEERKANE